MVRLLTFVVVFVLSGIPATAVVCDLLVCAEPGAAPQQRCHAHSTTQPGERIAPGPSTCDHLVAADPFVASAPRPAPQDAPSTGSSWSSLSASLAIAHAACAPPSHGPPAAARTRSNLPLRI